MENVLAHLNQFYGTLGKGKGFKVNAHGGLNVNGVGGGSVVPLVAPTVESIDSLPPAEIQETDSTVFE